MRAIRWTLPLTVAIALPLAACGGDTTTESTADPGGTTATDAAGGTGDGVCGEGDHDGLLAQICEEGVITVSTDPAYPPQSSLNTETGEYEGFDIDVASEIAARLGVEIAWEAPAWDVITAGSWNGRWDMSVGSMTPTNSRQQVLHFTQPYYFTPAVAVVREDDTEVVDLSTDLDGKSIGVCSGCTYEQYLNKELDIEGFTFDFSIDDASVSGYDTDTTALQDLVSGRVDAVITSLTTAQGYIDAGNPVKVVGDPVFYEPLSVGFDRSADPSAESLAEAVDGLVAELHSDGRLTALSEQWYGVDLTKQQ